MGARPKTRTRPPSECIDRKDKLEWITQEDSTILVFLPLPDTGRATSPQSKADMLDTAQLSGHADVLRNRQLNPPPKQQPLHCQTQPLTHQGETLQKSQGNDLLQEEISPSSHQIVARIPDTRTVKGRKPTFTQTIPVPTSLDSLKEGLSLLLSITKQICRILYGGKILDHQATLEAQGVTKGTTVWLTIGGLLGGADMDWLGHKATGRPKEAPTSTLRQNETFTLSNLNILSARPLITVLAEVGFQPDTTGHWHRDITFRPPR